MAAPRSFEESKGRMIMRTKGDRAFLEKVVMSQDDGGQGNRRSVFSLYG